jgi:uncharacterized protein
MQILATISPVFILSGFVVGLLVGLTGVGGGSLMTPLLVLVFGVQATTAVGTDLLYAAVTKGGGAIIRHRHGTIDWQVTRRLAIGSLPAAAVTLVLLYELGVRGGTSPRWIAIGLACALIVTAICVVSHRWLRLSTATHAAEPDGRRIALLTMLAGGILGVLVTLTSVGAGAIGMTALVLLYPRTPIVKLVGSDIAHAVPLTLLAGIGHWLLGSVNWLLLLSLLIGSMPGIAFGSHLSARVPDKILRPILALTLLLIAIRMLRP